MMSLGMATILIVVASALLAAATFLTGFICGRARGDDWRRGWDDGYNQAILFWGTRLALEKQQAAATKTPVTSEVPEDTAQGTDAAPISEKPNPSKKPN